MFKYLLFSVLLTSLVGCSSTPEYTSVPRQLEQCSTYTSASVKYGVKVGGVTKIECGDYIVEAKCETRYDTVQLPNGRWSEEAILMCPDNRGGMMEVTYISTE